MKLSNWRNIYIIFLLKITFLVSFTISWTNIEKSYKGNCQEDHVHGDQCADLGEHAYKGVLLDEPPKGLRYYIDDLEPYYDINFDREKRSFRKKESKATPTESSTTKDDEEIDESEEADEERIEKPTQKSSTKKRNKKKKLEENIEKKGEDDDDDEDDQDEGNDNEGDESSINEEGNIIENYRSGTK